MSRRARELREKTTEELADDLAREREHILKGIRLPLAGGQRVNSHEVRQTRRKIACIMTILRERELGIRGRESVGGGEDGAGKAAGEAR